jgi:hypothetical protein
MQKTIPISKFKATCLRLLENVNKTGKSIIVTRKGEHTYFRSTDNAVSECDPDSDMLCIMAACGPKGTTLNCGDEVIEIIESKEISVPFGGPFTAWVNRKHNEDEPGILYWFQYLYIVPGVGMIKEVDWWNDTPLEIRN